MTRRRVPHAEADVQVFLKEEWPKLELDGFLHYLKEMPARVRAVLDAQGRRVNVVSLILVILEVCQPQVVIEAWVISPLCTCILSLISTISVQLLYSHFSSELGTKSRDQLATGINAHLGFVISKEREFSWSTANK